MTSAYASDPRDNLPSWVRNFAVLPADGQWSASSPDFTATVAARLAAASGAGAGGGNSRRRSASSTDDPDSGIQLSTPSELVAALSSHRMTSTPIKTVGGSKTSSSSAAAAANVKRNFNSISAVSDDDDDDAGGGGGNFPPSQDSSVSTVIKRDLDGGGEQRRLMTAVEQSLDALLADSGAGAAVGGGDRPEAKKAISNFLNELSRLFPGGQTPRIGNADRDGTSSDMDITVGSRGAVGFGGGDGNDSDDDDVDGGGGTRDLLSDALATGTVTDRSIGTTAASSSFFVRPPAPRTRTATAAPSSPSPARRRFEFGDGDGDGGDEASGLNEFISPLVDSSALEMSRNFRSSYAEWIGKMFDSQVANMRLKLESQFQDELKKVREEKNREISELHEGYERKLVGCRATSERLEAQLKRAARDFIQMNEMKSRQIKELKNMLEVEQRRSADRPTREDFDLAWEGQRLAMQQRHTEKLRAVVESTREKLQEIQDHYQLVSARLSEELYQVSRERDAIRQELVDAKTKLNRLEGRMLSCNSCAALVKSPTYVRMSKNDSVSQESCATDKSGDGDGENDGVRRFRAGGNSVDGSSEAETEYMTAKTRSEAGSAEDFRSCPGAGKTNGSILNMLDSMRLSLNVLGNGHKRGSHNSSGLSSSATVQDEERSVSGYAETSPTVASPGQLALMSAKLRQQLKSLESSLNKQDECDRRKSSTSK